MKRASELGGVEDSEPVSKVQRTDFDQDGDDRSEETDKNLSRRSVRAKPVPRRTFRKEEKLPTIMYKEGEPLKDLSKYKSSEGDSRVEVRIPPQTVSHANRQVRARQLWGADIYTEDSDLVAVLMHLGYVQHSLSQLPSSVAEVRAVLTVLDLMDSYPCASRNSIRSRAWGSRTQGCSYKVERCWLVTNGGARVELEPSLEGAQAVSPTFTPAHFERAMNTRSSASSTERRHRTMHEVTLQYNLCNEPWLKYSMAAVADGGLKPSQWTSARLHKEVLFLETHRERYEISRIETSANEASDAPQTEQYRWARCLQPLPLSKIMKVGVPLPEEHIKVLAPCLSWEDFQWGATGLWVKGQYVPVIRLNFTARQRPGSAES